MYQHHAHSHIKIAAAAIFLDEDGKMLILKPSYRDHWTLPGGIVEENESPRKACLREVKEETGLNCSKLTFLSVDYINSIDHNSSSLHFTFFGGALKKSDAEQISVDNTEIVDYKFLPVKEALEQLHVHMRPRIQKCLDAIETGTALYLENGEF